MRLDLVRLETLLQAQEAAAQQQRSAADAATARLEEQRALLAEREAALAAGRKETAPVFSHPHPPTNLGLGWWVGQPPSHPHQTTNADF